MKTEKVQDNAAKGKYLFWSDICAVLFKEQVLHELGKLDVLQVAVFILIIVEPDLWKRQNILYFDTPNPF